MDIPIQLNGPQQDRLRAVLIHGDPDFFIIDDVVNGSPLYMLVARGKARDWAISSLYSRPSESAEATPSAPEPAAPEQPPVRIVPVSEGPRSAGPTRKA